jgi:hypothetical protein
LDFKAQGVPEASLRGGTFFQKEALDDDGASIDWKQRYWKKKLMAPAHLGHEFIKN